MNEPVVWQNYDQSSLPNLLRHGTWNRHCGLPLLSGIDPRNSESFNPLYYYKIPDDEVHEFAARVNLDIETIAFWKIQLLADPPNSARRTWYENVDDYEEAIYYWDKIRDQFSEMANEKSLNELLKDRYVAKNALDEFIEIFDSNPQHNANSAFPPSYYLSWAKSKNLDIAWLDWAKARVYIDGSAVTGNSDEIDLDKRERDTLHAMIGALLHKLGIDPGQHGVIKRIVGITEDYNAPIGKTKISEVLRNIPAAKETVQDRKRR